MTTVFAEYQDRRRIVFTSRGRSSVNVRESLDDGPIGYTSTELLLIAMGNCSLGTLLNHPLLKDETIDRAYASIEAAVEPETNRVTSVALNIEIHVDNTSLQEHLDELAAVACTGPTCSLVTSGYR